MPFIRIGKGASTHTSADEEPIFLFPGVIGYTELASLATELAQKNPNRPVYMWQHPSYHNQNSPATFSAFVQHIAEEIFKILPSGQGSSYSLFGHSFGGVLAEAVAHYIKASNETNIVHAGTIDTLAVQLLKEDFNTKSTKLTTNLAEILNATARAAGLPERKFTADEIKAIKKLDLYRNSAPTSEATSDQISTISSRISETCWADPTKEKAFNNFRVMSRVVNHHLSMLATSEFKPSTKLDSLCTWFTEETRKKHKKEKNTGREHTAEKFASKKLDGNHHSCVDRENAPALANSITKHLDKQLGKTAKVRRLRKVSDGFSIAFIRPEEFDQTSSPSCSSDSSPDSSPRSASAPTRREFTLDKHSKSSGSDDSEGDRLSQDSEEEFKVDSAASYGTRGNKNWMRLGHGTRGRKQQQMQRVLGKQLSVDTEQPATEERSAMAISP